MTGAGSLAGEHDLAALRERKRLFDDVWLAALVVIFLAVAVPWFLRILDFDLAPLAWSLFIFGITYVALGMASDRLQSRRYLLLVVNASQILGVLFLSFLWHLAGGLQNPMFLLVFVLPVVAGSLVLVNWQSCLTVLLAALTVTLVALVEAPELRWYMQQSGVPADWLIRHLPELATASRPFPTLSTPAPYLFVLLELFAVLLLAAAMMTGSFNALLLRLYDRLGSSVEALTRSENRSLEVLRASPVPTALVYCDTFKVEQVSESFMRELVPRTESLADKNLFDLIHFSYPDVVEALIAGEGGELPMAVYRVGDETRMAKVRVHPIAHEGTRYACVSIEDISTWYYLDAASRAMGEALLAVDAGDRTLYFNHAAEELFGAMHVGMDAAATLRPGDPGNDWWRLGMRKQSERQVEFAGKRYRAACVVLDVPGERGRLTMIRLRLSEGRG